MWVTMMQFLGSVWNWVLFLVKTGSEIYEWRGYSTAKQKKKKKIIPKTSFAIGGERGKQKKR